MISSSGKKKKKEIKVVFICLKWGKRQKAVLLNCSLSKNHQQIEAQKLYSIPVVYSAAQSLSRHKGVEEMEERSFTPEVTFPS